MELKIVRDSNFTIHTQLKEQIKSLILDNLIEQNSQLPTVRQLGDFLRINKNTVSKVYKELEEEGYVFSIKGKGTFVSDGAKSKKTTGFFDDVDRVIKKGLEDGLSVEEIWGIVYSRTQHFKLLKHDKNKRAIAFAECNRNAMDDFNKMIHKEINDLEIKNVLIDDLINNFEEVKKNLSGIDILVIPYIHFEEVKKELKKLNKEVITIGANQSLKILTYHKKLKNKVVGFVGHSEEDELGMSKQFLRMNIKETKFYGGFDKKGDRAIKEFMKGVNTLIFYSTVFEKVKDNISKPYFLFEGKYDKSDIKILKDIFR